MESRHHPIREIDRAIVEAKRRGFRWRSSSRRGRVAGWLMCKRAGREGCLKAVFRNPTNPASTARAIADLVRNCPHEV
jgi:ABC-type sugar transport system substrate-binding protein